MLSLSAEEPPLIIAYCSEGKRTGSAFMGENIVNTQKRSLIGPRVWEGFSCFLYLSYMCDAVPSLFYTKKDRRPFRPSLRKIWSAYSLHGIIGMTIFGEPRITRT